MRNTNQSPVKRMENLNKKQWNPPAMPSVLLMFCNVDSVRFVVWRLRRIDQSQSYWRLRHPEWWLDGAFDLADSWIPMHWCVSWIRRRQRASVSLECSQIEWHRSTSRWCHANRSVWNEVVWDGIHMQKLVEDGAYLHRNESRITLICEIDIVVDGFDNPILCGRHKMYGTRLQRDFIISAKQTNIRY